ncbi:HflK protein [Thioalkalivibrio nitratireducens DSM 14787]|uniref:Protein HflK n=1 Tax=Thioalkalivibrio nitratireducens (strain DSM 14787 / UNIQEM 213 / ALEN2) TaxID=1255043 RepID=L0DZA3_THIND|nr:FtsH protease activity modulator HflK [Thioalkalivibrio nitratireducens]AGA34904.1 HflK protein [Thioalkalivibrio nitratireducens DSM 14787]
MPWNEPGNNQRDPWSGGPRGGGGGGGQRPPDLEEMMRKLSQQLSGIFGGGGSGGSDGGGGMGRHSKAVASLAVIIAVVVWLASGFYIVSEGDRGIVFRFGAFQKESMPGPHWHLPYPIERVEIENVDNIRTLQNRALMLTADENIIDVDIAVQYRVKDLRDFKFNVRNPDATVQQAMESAIRERVGKHNLDYILGEGRGEIALSARETLQQALDSYGPPGSQGAGIIITATSMQQAQPPEPVQESFADAIRAREDEARFRNEAEAYANGLIPRARGQAARVFEEAEAYRDQVIARAEGDAARFTQLLAEYQVAPSVTRDRLYLEMVEAVFQGSNKVLLDIGSSHNLTLLPLDQLLKGTTPGTAPADAPQPLDTTRGVFSPSVPGGTVNRLGTTRPDPRAREVR